MEKNVFKARDLLLKANGSNCVIDMMEHYK